MGIRQWARKLSDHFWDREYEKKRAGKTLTYASWERIRESRVCRNAVKQAGFRERFLVLTAKDVCFGKNTEKLVFSYFDAHPEVWIAYAGTDKPDWSPDAFLDHFYIGDVLILDREKMGLFLRENGEQAQREQQERQEQQEQKVCREDKTPDTEGKAWISEAGSRVQVPEEKWKKLVHYLCEIAGGFERRTGGSGHIGHIPYNLYEAESSETGNFVQSGDGSRNAYDLVSATVSDPIFRLIRGKEWNSMEALCSKGMPEEVSKEAPGRKVSVIIPSRDHPDLLKQCVKALLRTGAKAEKTQKHPIPVEVIVVDNGSSPQNRTQIQDFLQTISVPWKYLYQPMEFHFSRMCNLGAEAAGGAYLLFLNDDVEMVTEGWLEEMLAIAARPYAGAVGCKLLYPGKERIQHIGIFCLPSGPMHKLLKMSDAGKYPDDSSHGVHNVLAVTAACLLVSGEKFSRVGGFCEELAVAYNDVDLCLKLYATGYYNAVCNLIQGIHYESFSRGEDLTEVKRKRLLQEKEILFARNPLLLKRDPYILPSWDITCPDAAIRPAWQYAGNQIQNRIVNPAQITGADGQPLRGSFAEENDMRLQWKGHTIGLRRDNCLLFHMDCADRRLVCGYGIVLGDDNACYDRYLLLIPVNEGCESAYCYVQELEGQYRPDLEENLTDQKNIALAGFLLEGWSAGCNGLPAKRDGSPAECKERPADLQTDFRIYMAAVRKGASCGILSTNFEEVNNR